MSPAPPDHSKHQPVRAFYDEVYYRDTTTTTVPPAHAINLARRLGIRDGDRVLDVGCGTGVWLTAVSRSGGLPHGIDISANALTACRAALPNADLHCAPAEALPWPDDTFDLVTCLGSLEHFLEPLAALKDMVRATKDGGRILILVPNADFLTRKLGLFQGTDQAQIRELVLRIEQWEELFATAGLVVIERWKDLHVLSGSWIRKGPWLWWPVRAAQAVALAVWPLRWQYQVYFLCRVRKH
jgi:SAM-dependent methyltransferase